MLKGTLHSFILEAVTSGYEIGMRHPLGVGFYWPTPIKLASLPCSLGKDPSHLEVSVTSMAWAMPYLPHLTISPMLLALWQRSRQARNIHSLLWQLLMTLRTWSSNSWRRSLKSFSTWLLMNSSLEPQWNISQKSHFKGRKPKFKTTYIKIIF